MKEPQESFRAGLRSLPLPVFVYVPKTLAILDVNDAAVERYGYTAEQFSSMSLHDVMPPKERKPKRRGLERSKGRAAVDGPLQHHTAHGESLFVETIATDVSYDGHRAQALIVLDVSERLRMEGLLQEAERARREAEARLRDFVNQDAVSRPSSRAAIDRCIGDLLAERTDDVFVLFVLLDGLDIVSNTIGYSTSDRLVEQAEGLLRDLVDEHTVVGEWRYGQFVVSGYVGMYDLGDLAARMEGALRKPMQQHYRNMHVGIRIGVASSAVDSQAEDLIRRASLAAHHAVGNGGGVSHFEPSMESGLRSRLALEHALHLGIESGELRFYVQPIVDAQTEQIISAEVLLRWDTPVHGLLSPASFIEMAENTGLIIPIGAYVLNATCALAKECERLHIDVPIAMNVSAKQLTEKTFFADVQNSMAHHAIRPSQLIFELTESALMSDVRATSKMLSDLRDTGLRIAIDDFGTGYSSLSRLKHIDFDILKIDCSFVQDYSRNAMDRAIVDSATSLGKNAGLEVVAEGVETVEQASALREAGVTAMQGFYFARPMPPAEFLRGFDTARVSPKGNAAKHWGTL